MWACAWTAFVSMIFLFPTVQPVTPINMNCTPPLPSPYVLCLAGVGHCGVEFELWVESES